jgi:hypothetical protein
MPSRRSCTLPSRDGRMRRARLRSPSSAGVSGTKRIESPSGCLPITTRRPRRHSWEGALTRATSHTRRARGEKNCDAVEGAHGAVCRPVDGSHTGKGTVIAAVLAGLLAIPAFLLASILVVLAAVPLVVGLIALTRGERRVGLALTVVGALLTLPGAAALVLLKPYRVPPPVPSRAPETPPSPSSPGHSRRWRPALGRRRARRRQRRGHRRALRQAALPERRDHRLPDGDHHPRRPRLRHERQPPVLVRLALLRPGAHRRRREHRALPLPADQPRRTALSGLTRPSPGR